MPSFISRTAEFMNAGLSGGERALVAVPGAKIAPMRAALNGAGDRVEFWDMNELGANPGRIIPAVRDWVDRGAGRCRFIGEPIWPGRSATEVTEATRHEALINLAFADADAVVMCPYDAARLDRAVLLDAERTHPGLIHRGQCGASARYADPLEIWSAGERALSAPAGQPATHPIDLELGELRAFAARALRDAGLGRERVEEVVLAIDEAATNALVHGRRPARLRIWREGDGLICEISDRGCLTDPLAGRRRPLPDWPGGRGVWMMNELCDLVELRPTATGTVARLHVRLACAAWPSAGDPGQSGATAG